jgi:threonine dehydrogenase-like Zn-dependent dehydrogenase
VRTVYFEKNIPKILLAKALRPLWPNVVFSPLSPTRFEDIPEMPLPGTRWVRVRNRLGGICASDLHLLYVEADPKVAPAALPGTDRIYLGHEILGEVTEVGPEVTSLEVGDRVIMDAEAPNCHSQEIEPACRHCREGNEALCENTSVGVGPYSVGGGWGEGFTAHEHGVYKVPSELDDENGVMIEPLSVGVRAVSRRLPQPGERVLVVGCGTVGLATIQAVCAFSPDCHLTGMARYPQQVEMAHQLGVDRLVAGDEPYEATARITAGKLYNAPMNDGMILGGFDVIYDCVGTARTVQDCLRWARAGGTVVLVGVSLKPMCVDLTPVWYQEVDLIGLYAHGVEEYNGGVQSTYELTTDLLVQGKLTAEGFITHRFSLDQWRRAVHTATDKRSGAIKVVLDYRTEG